MKETRNNSRMVTYIKGIQSISGTPKTKKDLLKEGFFKIGGWIFLLILLFVTAALFGGFEKLFTALPPTGINILMFLGAALGMIILPLMGLWDIFKGLSSSQREISCPYCSQNTLLLSQVQSSVCPNCGKLLHYSSNTGTPEMMKTECPICKTEWGMAKDGGKVSCQACGNTSVSKNGTIQLVSTDGQCPSCNKPVQKMSFFCPSCGELLTQPSLAHAPFRPDTESWSGSGFVDENLNGYMPDGMIREGYLSNSAKGHIIQAIWLENTIRKELELAISKKEPITYFTIVQTWLGRLDRIIAQLGFALELNSNYVSVAQEIFTETDRLVGLSIRQAVDWETGEFKTLLNTQSFFASEKHCHDYLTTISETRNNFLNKLRTTAVNSNSFSSLEQWDEPVFDFGNKNAGNTQRIYILDWNNSVKGKWFTYISKFNQDDSLPSIRIPKIIMAE